MSVQKHTGGFTQGLLFGPAVSLLRSIVPVQDIVIHIADQYGVMGKVEERRLFPEILIGC